jgi:4-alpha-glucanotransferase
LFIGFDQFLLRDFITQEELAPLSGLSPIAIDYGSLIPIKIELLRRVFSRWSVAVTESERQSFEIFKVRTHWWLPQYAAYMVLKEQFGGPYWGWPVELRLFDQEVIFNEVSRHTESLEFQFWLQWIFFNQWKLFRGYANKLGVKILGDVPLYVSPDSVEGWSDRNVLSQHEVAGVPPDSFQPETGQLWNNPVYQWETNKDLVMQWWVTRMGWLSNLYDGVRIDHFRGIIEAWAVPKGSVTARYGRWMRVPGFELMNNLASALGDSIQYIAEDLGEISAETAREVERLRALYSIPGIAVVALHGFDGSPDNPFHPWTLQARQYNDRVAVTSTHDDNTVVGWWSGEAGDNTKMWVAAHHDFVAGHNYGNRPHLTGDGQRIFPGWAVCEMVAYTPCEFVVLRWQDLLNLTAGYRDNRPGTVVGNWRPRVLDNALSQELAAAIRALLYATQRLPGER